jgi:hypothetical protein
MGYDIDQFGLIVHAGSLSLGESSMAMKMMDCDGLAALTVRCRGLIQADLSIDRLDEFH